MGIKKDAKTFTGLFQERLARRKSDARVLRPNTPVASNIRVFVYFADDAENSHQLLQWAPFLTQVAETIPIAIITRSALTAKSIADATELPVYLALSHPEFETIYKNHLPGAIIYVNHHQANFVPLWQPEPVHIYIGHGESAKTGISASNQLKAYDQCFVAGAAGRDRIAQRLFDYDVERRVKLVGRPDVANSGLTRYSNKGDQNSASASSADDASSKIAVLYAPTWEGDRATNDYSSLTALGAELVEAIVADDRYRLIFRPHPATGSKNAAYLEKQRQIVAAIESANRGGNQTQHIVDKTAGLGATFAQADVCIGDVASVTYDWLATKKPLLVTGVRDDKTAEHERLFEQITVVTLADLPNIGGLISSASTADSLLKQESFSEYVFGETDADQVRLNWLTAIETAITDRAELARSRSSR